MISDVSFESISVWCPVEKYTVVVENGKSRGVFEIREDLVKRADIRIIDKTPFMLVRTGNVAYDSGDRQQRLWDIVHAQSGYVIGNTFSGRYREFLKLWAEYGFTIQDDGPVFQGRRQRITSNKRYRVDIYRDGKVISLGAVWLKKAPHHKA